MKHKTYDFRTAYIDLLLNILTGIIFLFVLTSLLIQPVKEKTDPGLKKNAEFVINVRWNNDIDCDVDIWVRDPLGNIVSFKKKESGIMYIERDDIGIQGDLLMDSKDKIVGQVSDNSETWVLRGLITGKFTVNLHVYACRKDKSVPAGFGYLKLHYQIGEPIELPVTVELIKVNPNYEILKTETVTLKKVWDETTIFNFELNQTGNAYNFTKDPVNLIKIKPGE